MLQSLHVKNLALLDEAEVEFESGLNILTGETGAGKSIIIGSVNLALGEKVPKEMLRDNGEAALVELLFSVENPVTLAELKELEIEPEDGLVVLSRKITPTRAVGRINGETVSAAKMQEAASLLVDIHGQHEHQSLLSRRKHLEILDEFAKKKLQDKKPLLARAYREYKKMKEEWEVSHLDTEEQKRELSFLEYEVKEITEAGLSIGEDERLEEEFRRFTNGKKIMEAVNNAYRATGGEDGSAAEQVGYALKEVLSVASYDKNLQELAEQLGDVDNLLSDINRSFSGYLADADFDGERFYEVEKRLNLINRLKSKYGNSIPAILENCEEKSARIRKLLDYESYLGELAGKLKKKEGELEQLCQEVSRIRQEEANVLCAAIAESLMQLNFLDVRFTMEFKRTADYSSNGFDEGEFYISTNPGEPLKPLDKVASGGELSRIMLAIKTVMAKGDAIDTLIFDEIDSGISGRTAQMVSEKMNLLGREHQVICITHLPQIAAMADAHFLIEKSVQDNSTLSSIRKLEEENCIQELARMLGGVEITDKVYENAREMKQMAYMKK